MKDLPQQGTISGDASIATQMQEADRYFRALGAFIHHFGGVEARARVLLTTLSGLQPNEGNALFDGFRVRQIIEKIQRLHEARKTPLDPNLSACFKQLQDINGARDWLIHQRTEFQFGLRQR